MWWWAVITRFEKPPGAGVEIAKRGKNTKIAELQFRIVDIGRTVFKGLASGPGGSWNTKSLMTGPLKTHLPMADVLAQKKMRKIESCENAQRERVREERRRGKDRRTGNPK